MTGDVEYPQAFSQHYELHAFNGWPSAWTWTSRPSSKRIVRLRTSSSVVPTQAFVILCPCVPVRTDTRSANGLPLAGA